jgi:hypothetical protein
LPKHGILQIATTKLENVTLVSFIRLFAEQAVRFRMVATFFFAIW